MQNKNLNDLLQNISQVNPRLGERNLSTQQLGDIAKEYNKNKDVNDEGKKKYEEFCNGLKGEKIAKATDAYRDGLECRLIAIHSDSIRLQDGESINQNINAIRAVTKTESTLAPHHLFIDDSGTKMGLATSQQSLGPQNATIFSAALTAITKGRGINNIHSMEKGTALTLQKLKKVALASQEDSDSEQHIKVTSNKKIISYDEIDKAIDTTTMKEILRLLDTIKNKEVIKELKDKINKM